MPAFPLLPPQGSSSSKISSSTKSINRQGSSSKKAKAQGDQQKDQVRGSPSAQSRMLLFPHVYWHELLLLLPVLKCLKELCCVSSVLLVESAAAAQEAATDSSSSSSSNTPPVTEPPALTVGDVSLAESPSKPLVSKGNQQRPTPAVGVQQQSEAWKESQQPECKQQQHKLPPLQHPEGSEADTTHAPSSSSDHPTVAAGMGTAAGHFVAAGKAVQQVAATGAAQPAAAASPPQPQQQHQFNMEDPQVADLWARGQQHAQQALQQLQSVQQQLRAIEEQQTGNARRALRLPPVADTPREQQPQHSSSLSQDDLTDLQKTQQNPVSSKSGSYASADPVAPTVLQETAASSSQQQQQQPFWRGGGLWKETVSSPLGPHNNQIEAQPHRQFSSSISDLSNWLSGAAVAAAAAGSGSVEQQQSADRSARRSTSMGILGESDSLSAAIASLGQFVENFGWSLAPAPANEAAVATPNADASPPPGSKTDTAP